MWFITYHMQHSVESLLNIRYKNCCLVYCRFWLIILEPLGPTLPPDHGSGVLERCFFDHSVLLISVISRADVYNIVMMPLCVLVLASRGYRSCSHLTDSTSPSPFTYPSAFCASYFVRVWDWFHRSKGVICRILIDWCAEMLFKQIALQDPQALMSPRPCILPITNSSNGRSHQCTS